MLSQTSQLEPSPQPDGYNQFEEERNVPVIPHPHQRETYDEAQLRDPESMFVELTNDDIAPLNELISCGVQHNHSASDPCSNTWTKLMFSITEPYYNDD